MLQYEWTLKTCWVKEASHNILCDSNILHEISETGTSIEIRWADCLGLGVLSGNEEWPLMGLSFWTEVIQLMVMMVSQSWRYWKPLNCTVSIGKLYGMAIISQ